MMDSHSSETLCFVEETNFSTFDSLPDPKRDACNLLKTDTAWFCSVRFCACASDFRAASSPWPAPNKPAIAAMIGTALLGWAFERLVILPVYGQHLKQILITTGGLIVAEEAVKLVWGGEQKAMALPTGLRGAVVFGDVAIEKYRLVAAAVGLVVFVVMTLVLNRTKIGLLIRAGVENREMVEALGYPVKRLFVLVFAAGSALAGLGGTLWAFYRETLTAHIGGEVIVLVFIVVIIGGLGSVGGCFIGALMVAMVANYTGFLAPKLALLSNILLMATILMWRPEGLYPVARR